MWSVKISNTSNFKQQSLITASGSLTTSDRQNPPTKTTYNSGVRKFADWSKQGTKFLQICEATEHRKTGHKLIINHEEGKKQEPSTKKNLCPRSITRSGAVFSYCIYAHSISINITAQRNLMQRAACYYTVVHHFRKFDNRLHHYTAYCIETGMFPPVLF